MTPYMDCTGRAIKVGDRIEFVVGIPGRTVIARVVDIKGRLHVCDGEGRSPLRQVLKWFNCYVVAEMATA